MFDYHCARWLIWAMGDTLGIRDEDFQFLQLKHIQKEMSRNYIGCPAGIVADTVGFARCIATPITHILKTLMDWQANSCHERWVERQPVRSLIRQKAFEYHWRPRKRLNPHEIQHLAAINHSFLHMGLDNSKTYVILL